MENYKAIVEQARAIKIEDSFDRQRRFSREYEAATTTAEKIEVNKRHDAECRAEDERKIKRLVLIHNAEVAYVAEVLPKICAVYQRYAGKNIGKARQEKMLNEIKEATGGDYAFLNNDGITFYHPYGNKRIQLYFKYNKEADAWFKAYDTEGKLNKIEQDMFSYGKHYIDDIGGYIKQKTEQAKCIASLSKQLEAAQHDYNDGLAEGLYAAEWGKTNTYQRIYR